MTSFATKRPIAVLMVFVAAVVFGYFSYSRLAVRLMPEMSYPTITVRTEYDGAAPQEVEKDISRPLEEALGVISGLRRISSVSRAGVSDVILEFSWDTGMADAVQDIYEKLDLVLLPEEAGASLILRFDPSLDPVLELSLSSVAQVPAFGQEEELRRLRRLAEQQVKRALEPIRGVAAARVRGGLEEEIHVLVDSGALTSAGMSLSQVIRRLQEENINVAGGTIEDGGANFMVRTLNEYQHVEEIADTILVTVANRPIRVRDVAKVLRSHRERDIITHTNGKDSVQIEVFKEADANMVALSKRVRQKLEGDSNAMARGQRPEVGPTGLAATLREHEQAELRLVADRSVFIENSIREVRNTAILGGFFAIVVLFLFLRSVRTTVIIGISIPISLIVTFAPLNLMGVSLNIMSLGGLALGVGMLVDSSIVVLESIVRNQEEGKDLVTATVAGTNDVRGAVIASTLTTIGVFLPMVFVDGVAGQAFGDLGLAVVLSLLASLVVALYLLPMLASRKGGGNASIAPPSMRFRWGSWQTLRTDFVRLPFLLRLLLSPFLLVRFCLGTVLEVFAYLFVCTLFVPIYVFTHYVLPPITWLMRGLCFAPLYLIGKVMDVLRETYPRFLLWTLRRGKAVCAVMAGCFALTYVAATELDTELLPQVHQGEFTFELALPVGTTIEDTSAILSSVETSILTDIDLVESLLVTYGYDATSSKRSDEGEHTARFKVLLRETSNNARAEDRVSREIRKLLAGIPDLEERLVRPVLFSFQTPVEVEIYGEDLSILRELSGIVQEELRRHPDLSDVETSLRRGAPEVQIVYDRDRIRRYGLNIADVAGLVRDEVKGRVATRFTRDDRKIPIVVQLAHEYRARVEDLKRLVIDPEKSGTIRLSSVADIVLGEGASEVRRVDGRRVAVVRANLQSGAALGTTVRDVRSRLDQRISWPSSVSYDITGQDKEWQESRRSLWLALALSIFLVYVIMAAQFESLVFPLIIMLSIPLAFLGTFGALNALGVHLSIIVFLGMIMLAGIVVNNAIVLVDYINILRRRGMELQDAVVAAGTARLRPILMTTLTTALGLTPMALGLGDGAELRTPLAIAVISGLLVSTVLTLVLIPTLYVVVVRLGERLATLFSTAQDEGEEEAG